MEVTCVVKGQTLTVLDNHERFSKKSDSFIRFNYTFSEDWEGLRIFAQFRQGDNVDKRYLADNNSVTLPNWLKPGVFFMTLCGTAGSVTATTNSLRMLITDSGLETPGDGPEAETLYRQLLEEIKAQKKAVSAVQADLIRVAARASEYADAAVLRQGESVEEYHQPILRDTAFSWAQGTYNTSAAEVASDGHIRTGWMTGDDTLYRFAVPDGYELYVYERLGVSSAQVRRTYDTHYYLADKSLTFAFVLNKAEGDIAVADAANLGIKTYDYDRGAITPIGHGIYTIPLLWAKGCVFDQNRLSDLPAPTSESVVVSTTPGCAYHFSTGKDGGADRAYASQPIPIPKSGMRVTVNTKYRDLTGEYSVAGPDTDVPTEPLFPNAPGDTADHVAPDNGIREDTPRPDAGVDDDLVPYWRVVFYKRTATGISASDDERLIPLNYNVGAASSGAYFYYLNMDGSMYIPYVEDTYVVLMLYDKSSLLLTPVDLSGYEDYLTVYAGSITEDNGPLPGLLPVRVYTQFLQGEDEVYYRDLIVANYRARSLYSSSTYIGSLLPLRYVRRIICSPQYELLAEVWRVEKDGSGEKTATMFGREPHSRHGVGMLSGAPVIDVSDVEGDGYLHLAVRSNMTDKYTIRGVEGGYEATMIPERFGFLRGYEEVLQGVFVEYKPGYTVCCRGGMDAILAENIHVFCNEYLIDHTAEGRYTALGGYYKDNFKFPDQYRVGPTWYQGTITGYNSLFLNVSGQSYMTAAKNPNSRYYQMARLWPWAKKAVLREQTVIDGTTYQAGDVIDLTDVANPTDDQIKAINDSALGCTGYGLACTSLVAVLRGMKVPYECSTMAYGDTETETPDLERIAIWDYRRDLDKLRPGDMLVRSQYQSDGGIQGHVFIVTRIVEINGTVMCVDLIEAYPPFNRYRSLVDTDYWLLGEGTKVRPLTTGALRALKNYHFLLRPKPDTIKRLRDVFDLDTTYTNGALACDRGTNAVYCAEASHILISITNTAGIATLTIYRDGDDVPVTTADVSDLPKDVYSSGSSYKGCAAPGTTVVDIKGLVSDDGVTPPGLYTVKGTGTDGTEHEETFFVPMKLPAYVSTEPDEDGNVKVYVPRSRYDSYDIADSHLRYAEVHYQMHRPEGVAGYEGGKYCIHIDPSQFELPDTIPFDMPDAAERARVGMIKVPYQIRRMVELVDMVTGDSTFDQELVGELWDVRCEYATDYGTFRAAKDNIDKCYFDSARWVDGSSKVVDYQQTSDHDNYV